MFANKKRLFKTILLSVSFSIIGSMVGLSIGLKNINNIVQNNVSENSNLYSSSSSNLNSKTTNWNDESLISNNDYKSNPNTPNGYLTVTDKTINMISWFGSKSWSYDVSNSVFLTQANITGYNPSSSTISIHVYYLANYDRILVYGTVNSNVTYVFQLNSDGTEYYVNDSDTNKVANSSLTSTRNSNVISSVNSINLLSSDSAIILPSNINTTNYQLEATKFSLVNFSAVKTTYDASEWTINTDATLTNIRTSYTLSGIIGLLQSYDATTSYLILSGHKQGTNANLKYVSIICVKLVNNTFSTANEIIFSEVSATNFNINNATFKIVNSFANNIPVAYVSLVNDISNPNGIKTGPDSSATSSWGNSKNINQVIEFNGNDGVQNNYYVSPTTGGTILDIYINPYNSNPYALIKNKSENTFYFSDLLTSKVAGKTDQLIRISNYRFFPNVTSVSDTTRINLIWRPIFEEGIGNVTVLKGLVSSLTYSDATSTTPNSTNTKRFTIVNFTPGRNQNVTFDDFYATTINSYENLVTNYYCLLPQDVSTTILEEFIYLKNISNNNKVFTSSIVIPTNGLTVLNDKGTVQGTVNLNVTKWWLTGTATSDTSNFFTIPISINISGLATNSTLSFKVVNNNEVNSTKYQNILNLRKTKYPSAITAAEILSTFLDFGSSIKLTEANILMKNNTSTNDNTTPSDTQYITVVANDNDGTLSITWNLNSIISPSVLERSGSYTFNNFLYLNAWSKLSLDDKAWNTLKASKSPFQVTITDIIDSLNLSSGYSKDPSYWTWTPTYSLTSNKTQYINQSLEGNLTGTIKYNRSLGQVSSSVPDSDLQFTIDSTKGAGFLTLSRLLGSVSTSTLYYNQNSASKLASSYDLAKVESDFNNILFNSLSFYNDWTTFENMNYNIISSSNNTIIFNLSYKDNISTNLKTADGSNLVLDSDWINAIKASSNNVLNLDASYSFSYSLTSIEYNYSLTSTENTISIESVVKSSSSLNLDYSKIKASKFVNEFYNSQTNNYSDFLKTFDLIKLPTDTTAINYYYISDVQLTSDDVNGTVTVYYTFTFPNAGDVVGSSLTSSVVLNGFVTNQAISNNWLIICSIIVGIILLMIASGSTSIFVYKKRINSKRNKYGLGSQEQDLNLEYVPRKIQHSARPKRVRNTINGHCLSNKNRTSNYINNYSKLMKQMKKQKRK